MSGRLHSLLAAIILLMASAAWADGVTQAEFQGEPVGGIGGELTSLASDRDGTLWIGSRYAGIFVYRQGKFFLHNAYNTPIPDDGISAVYVDAKNVKWFGSERGYLYSFDGKRWQVFAASQEPRDSIALSVAFAAMETVAFGLRPITGQLVCSAWRRARSNRSVRM